MTPGDRSGEAGTPRSWIDALWRRWRRSPDEPPPLRAELFSVEQMAQHGRALAGGHGLALRRTPERLLKRLADNEQQLSNAGALLMRAVQSKARIAPAGEWLLDNFYLVRSQIRIARQHLPRGYSRELPRLATGPSQGLPRVYDLALEVISHGDGRVDAETMGRFVAAYQTVTPLTLGELWALPIMLRLALIENLRRVAVRITIARLHLNQAQAWAEAMMTMAESDPKSLILVIADMARSNPPMVSPFVAELARCLQGHGPALALPLNWIEQRLAETSQTIEQLVVSESQQQAADQVSISNTIGSLRFLGAMDWRTFVEEHSVVEKLLREDPDESYAAMDFATRDCYRQLIDRLGKRSQYSEADIAGSAIALARVGVGPAAHVGYYLVDRGRRQLERAIDARLSLGERLHRALAQSPLLRHVGFIVLLSCSLAALIVDAAGSAGLEASWLVVIGLLALLASSQLASALANWLATLLITPQRLPRMDYADGLPAEARTLVVVPSMLVRAADTEALLEALEVRFLGNRDEHLHFALLTDFADADAETMASDAALLAQAQRGIERLNQQYPGSEGDRFFLLHRPRRWNPTERLWMGYERKRGKLADLNAMLRGKDHEQGGSRFALVVGALATLSPIRYVLTLDTDTQLPRDTARQLVGAMMHPLNRPRFNAQGTVVTGGHAILQPRIAASLAGAGRTRYARLCSSEPGIDPYTRLVSDVYQDLFDEGSFIGKGIYEVDAFERVLAARFPENRILSHDLLEGCYARSGLVSDVDLLEAQPARYLDDLRRHQRWIRGDWQIAHWLLPRVPGLAGQRIDNPLSLLSRWKIFDNLRRSLAPLALAALLVAGWAALPAPWLWTGVALAIALLPTLLITLADALRRPDDVPLRQHLGAVRHASQRAVVLALFRLACLPFEALVAVAAITQTSWRMLVSGRRLLEWNASNEAMRGDGESFAATLSRMWIGPTLALLTAAGLAELRPEALPAAATILLLWLLSPALAAWLSRPLRRREAALSSEQTLFLRRIARKTWSFFERYVTAEDHWLPPDNFQEQPGPILAHRTSPTNIGLSLLATLAARDFGYIGVAALLERTGNTFATLALLPRHLGHFCNWIDTLTLKPLPPRYISTVDSGNFAGHLLTLRAGLLALAGEPIVGASLFAGLGDTLALFTEADAANRGASIESLRTRLAEAGAEPMDSLATLHQHLATIVAQISGLAVELPALAGEGAATWLAALQQQARAALDDLLYLAPWLDLPAVMPDSALQAAGDAERARIALLCALDQPPSLRKLAGCMRQLESALVACLGEAPSAELRVWVLTLRTRLALASDRAAQRIATIEVLAAQAENFATMDYEFLYDRSRHLLAIGYNLDEFRRDTGYYDLLASEARLCSFVAIAQGRLPQESWFALGRLLTTAGGEPMLASWSGSMFEYLMPQLVMPGYAGTLLDQTCRAAVARQIDYGRQRELPWGVSESGYNTVDASQNYQYHAFGVPGLGLKRGLADDLVVAPYASALALLVEPEAACLNLQRLATDGLEGACGFYEAIDYTPSRLPRSDAVSVARRDGSVGRPGAIVRSYMAHHQGMSLLALNALLLGGPMQRRFASDPQFQATLLLLQERIPKHSVFLNRASDDSDGHVLTEPSVTELPTPFGAQTLTPEVQLLSNGRYHVMVSNAGGGSSRWKGLAVTRWREDSSRDHWGSFFYLRDVASGEFWSAAHQPTCVRADHYEALFAEGRAELRRRDHGIETYSEVVVSPEDDIELRRLRLTNRSRVTRTIELTSYAEVVLAAPAADTNQTAFGNLFVQTELVPERHAILCTRRPRSLSDATPWMFHLLAAHGNVNGNGIGEISYETDRMRFIGRGRSSAAPLAMISEPGPLSGTAGPVLDPVVAIRCRITLEPEQSATLDWVTGAADNREAAMLLVEKYQDRHLADRVFDLAWTHNGVTLRQINASESDAQLYRRLAGPVLYANAGLRAESGLLMQNRRGQSGLWGYAISGDLPIVLLKIADVEHLALARQLIQCHAWWRLKGLVVDLVIWNEEHSSYRQRLHDQILSLVATGTEANAIDRPGGIFIRSADQISNEDRVLLQAVARVIVAGDRGSLVEQLKRRGVADKSVARLLPTRVHRPDSANESAPPQDLLLANEHGGFAKDGSEYLITTTAQRRTPLPWVNVIANPHFGTVITEAGLAYTWSENAHEFRLTPWNDDSIGASAGEAFYLRDEESGHVWSPTPLPVPSPTPYVTRHGFGYSVFEHTTGGIHSELWVYVDLQESVKFSVLRVRNVSGRQRRLSATGYVEWVLGDLRTKTAMQVVTEIDSASGALFAGNAYNTEFSGRIAFFDVDDVSRTLTGDRTEFLGRNGDLAGPAALSRVRLSGKVGAALDPCGALQVPFEIADGQTREIIFRLGAGRDREQARVLAQRFRRTGSARNALEQVRSYWRRTLSTVRVETPDEALNVLANGWLVYQVLACRLWARSGYYQSGGAFGFRDQLQDCMALVHAEPALVREHLLRSAEHQYREGDVQHWWHPPAGRGVRTRCSDDYLWLPLVACRYVETTGDSGALAEPVPFLEGRALVADEESYYDLPARASEVESLYAHCVLAIEHGLRYGAKGLPLMGSGDWNDGMNLVGIDGRGESVWLGFFLHEVLQRFAPLARMRGDGPFAERCLAEAAGLRARLDAEAWDGAWYRRAWFDDGAALGSAANDECRIDSIAQSWSVLSGAGEPARAKQAMESLDQHLVRREQRLIQLLDPPFDRSAMNPGYIKGYLPGVRENGGQYTHAAVWAAMAFAKLGDAPRAWELLALINPVNHGRSAEDVATYQSEPYVVAADVYAVAPHIGRGGWTWYTGSAGWLYRLIVESLLGLRRDGERLRIEPCMPAEWTTYSMDYRYCETVYRIRVIRAGADEGPPALGLRLDGMVQTDGCVVLVDDQRTHLVELCLR